MPEEKATQSETPQTKEKEASVEIPEIKKEKRWLKPLVFTSLGLILILLGLGFVFAGYQLSKRETSQIPSEEPASEPTSPISTPGIKGLTEDKIFFVEDKNVFMIDKTGENKVQITDFSETDFGYPQSLQVIDNEYLGFYKCDTETGNFNCGIYRVSVDSKQLEEIIHEEPKNFVLQLGWDDKNTFAYTVENSQEGGWSIFLSKNGSKTTLNEIPSGMYGRGGFVEDSSKISFSPDGTKIFQIATSSPRDPMDFNVYVFDLSSNQLAKIENSTQPAWLDDGTIIFRRTNEGLYSFSLSSKTERKYEGVSSQAYEPEVLDGKMKVVYWLNEDNGQVWLLDASSGEYEMLLNNAADPLWLSEEEILLAETRECSESEPCMVRAFSPVAVSVFNINTEVKNKLFDAEEGMGGGNIYSDITYYNSRWSD